MAMALDIVGWICVVSGSFFLIVGAVGVLRLPDVFARMHPTGLIDTMGSGLLVLGMTLQAGFGPTAVKLVLIMAFIFFSSPTATHALARAALGAGLKPLLESEPKSETNPNATPARSSRPPATRASATPGDGAP